MIPFSRPSITSEDLEVVTEVLKSGWLTDGPKNREFEEAFSAYIGVKHSITVNSCTSALELAISALGLQGEIILPSFTFVASANAVVNAGCRPVFADIEYDTYNISPRHVDQLITSKTEGVMVVHFAGCPANMEDITRIANKHHLAVIEDSAETIGGEFQEQKAGSFGVGCFSFFPTKNLTTGEGGMLTTDDDELAAKARAIAGHGIHRGTLDRQNAKRPWFREATLVGHNYRMPNPLAALGLSQLKRIDEMNDKRRSLADLYAQNMSASEISLPVEPKGSKHVYQTYAIKVPQGIRNQLWADLRNKGIEASVHFDPPVHAQQLYIDMYGQKNDLPVTELVSSSTLSLPMFPDMTEEDVEFVCHTVEDEIRRVIG